jgi:hypothetical protein
MYLFSLVVVIVGVLVLVLVLVLSSIKVFEIKIQRYTVKYCLHDAIATRRPFVVLLTW